MLIPVMAKVGGDSPLPVFAIRVLQGLFQGPALPATYAMAAKWLPRPEKTRLMAVISAGSQMFHMYTCSVCGIIALTTHEN